VHTVTADKQKRVRIPDAEPGQVFAYESSGEVVTLTPVKPIEPDDRPNKVRFVKRNGRTVGVTERPIDMRALAEALREFP